MTDAGPPQWERAVLEKVALKALDEQRRSRQWSALFKLLWFIFAFMILSAWLGWIGRPDKDSMTTGVGKHTALVDLEGLIAPDTKASADKVIKGLNRAFKDSNTQGVVLRINSPGGSPVQAGYINDEIRRLRAKYPNTPLFAVVQDLCASGGYYVAVAADKIYVDKASLVGSIGVIIGSFGFTGAMEKLGVERRAYMSGDTDICWAGLRTPSPDERGQIMSQIPGIKRQGTRSWVVAGLWVDLLGEVTTYGNSPPCSMSTPTGEVVLLTVEELLAERVFAARKWTAFNEEDDQCAKKLMACILRGSIPCDWSEARRIAALPAYFCDDEMDAMRLEVETELAAHP